MLKKLLVYFFLFFIGSFVFFKHPFTSLKEPITILAVPHESESWEKLNSEKILKNQKVRANFVAYHNNLGIVSVRFKTLGRANKDRITFRIKEVNASDWYYENIYKTDQFLDNQQFTFGFPPIQNAKNKTFEFEIISLDGTEKESVALSTTEPTFISKYSLDKSDPVSFLIGKIFTSFDSIKLLIQFSISIILAFLLHLFLNEKLGKRFKVKLRIGPKQEIALIYLGVFITLLILLLDNFQASLGLIDDHWIKYFLGPDNSIHITEIPRLISNTEVSQYGSYVRFRPMYYTMQVLETFFWRNNPTLWYGFRLLLFSTSFTIFIYLFKRVVGVIPSFIFALFVLTYPFWGDIMGRLGPAEIYGVFGTSLFALGAFRLHLNRNKKSNSSQKIDPNVLLVFFGFLLAAGAKENFLVLLLPTFYLLAIQLKRKKFDLTTGFLGMTVLFGLFVASAVLIAIAKTGTDVYESQIAVPDRVTLILRGVGLFINRLKILYFLLFIATSSLLLLIMKKRVRLKEHLISIGTYSFLIFCLLILFVSQYVFYNGSWPTSIRYDFPGILAEPFTWLIYIILLFQFIRIFKPRLSRTSLKVTVGLLFFILTLINGYDHLKEVTAINKARTNDFEVKYQRLLKTIEQNKGPLVYESYNLWDYEPIFSLQRYLAASGIQRDSFLIIHGYLNDAKAGSLEKRLVDELQRSSLDGPNEKFNFRPLKEFKNDKQCVSIVFSQMKRSKISCAVSSDIL